jgi:hypothetical protein
MRRRRRSGLAPDEAATDPAPASPAFVRVRVCRFSLVELTAKPMNFAEAGCKTPRGNSVAWVSRMMSERLRLADFLSSLSIP